jgi:hypothetical protein
VQVTTVYNKPKPFAWSYSKIKNYETCPKRYFHVDVERSFKEEEGEALIWGNAVHKALAERIQDGTPLPKGMEEFDKWCERILKGDGQILVEQKLALDENFGPVDWFAKTAWFRGIGDVIKIVGDVALVADWKTGKVLEDGSQLALMAACVFAHHPNVQRVRSEFIWLKHDASSRADYAREDMKQVWRTILPRVDVLRNAHETTTFPPKPGGLCRRYCIVTSCPHQGT